MKFDEIIFVELFKLNGYSIVLFGKWYNGEYYFYNLNGQGFDEFVGFCVGYIGNYFDFCFEYNFGLIQIVGFIIDVLMDKVIEWIEFKCDERFFCYIFFNVFYILYQVFDFYYEKYSVCGLDVRMVMLYGMVENVDDNMGCFFMRLEEFGFYENIIVFFLIDNGFNMCDCYNGGMKGYKGQVDEGGVWVFFFVCWSGYIELGCIVDGFVVYIDILLILVEFCGIEVFDCFQLDGCSLKLLFLNEEVVLSD